MKLNEEKTEYCCCEFRRFLGRCETFFHPWKPLEDDGLIRIMFNTVSGFNEFELWYCPFCGAKIEWIDEEKNV